MLTRINRVSLTDSIPDYQAIHMKWLNKYLKTNDPDDLKMAQHYANVAKEFGQDQEDISDDPTVQIEFPYRMDIRGI